MTLSAVVVLPLGTARGTRSRGLPPSEGSSWNIEGTCPGPRVEGYVEEDEKEKTGKEKVIWWTFFPFGKTPVLCTVTLYVSTVSHFPGQVRVTFRVHKDNFREENEILRLRTQVELDP